jgi:short-subunit dehydrogenase
MPVGPNNAISSARLTAASIVKSDEHGSEVVSLVSGRVLLTGATGGLGQAIARAFASRGASLLLSGRREEVLEQLARELGGRALLADLASREDLQRVIETAEAEQVEVLIANAGVPATGLLADISAQELDRMIDVNLRAPIALAKGLSPAMVARGAGHVVFMGSLSGKVASPTSSMYAATKFGLRGFALGLREDLRPHGVGVSVVLPSFIRQAGMFAQTGVKLPLGIGTRSPDDVASAVLRAVERNRAEIDVAPVGLRLGAAIGAVAPQLAADVSRLLGSERIAAAMDAGHREKPR